MSTPTTTDPPPRWDVDDTTPDDWAPEGTTAYNESPSAHDCRGDDDPAAGEGMDDVVLPAVSSSGAPAVAGLLVEDYVEHVRCDNEAADCHHLDVDHPAAGPCVVPDCDCEGLVPPDPDDDGTVTIEGAGFGGQDMTFEREGDTDG